MKEFENSKLDKLKSKVSFCLGEKLGVKAKLHEVLQNNWQVMSRVVEGQSSLSCLCSCDQYTVVVESLGVYFGRSCREKTSDSWRGFLFWNLVGSSVGESLCNKQ